MSTKPAKNDIDEYLSQFSPDVQAILQKIRAIARNAAPEAEEIISCLANEWRVAGCRRFGVAPNDRLVHCHSQGDAKPYALPHPPVSGDQTIEKAITPFAGPKGNLRFPLDQPIPYKLIERIVKLRVKQNAAKANTNQSSFRDSTQ